MLLDLTRRGMSNVMFRYETIDDCQDMVFFRMNVV